MREESMRPREEIQFTKEEVVPMSWRKLSVLLGAAAYLVLAFVITAAVLLEDHPRDGGSPKVFQKWRLMDLQTQPVNWLILGDSSGDTGVNPEIIEAELGGAALNLCTLAPMLVVNDAWMLEEHIRRVGKPRNVVIVHVYDVWRRKTREMLPMLHNVPRPWRYWCELEPTVDIPLADQFQTLILTLLPPLAKKRSLSNLISSKFLEVPDIADIGYAIRKKGFIASSFARASPEERKRIRLHVVDVAEGHLRQLPCEGVAPSEENRRALLRLLALSKEHGIQLYIVSSPLYAGLWAKTEFQRRYKELEGELRGLIQSSGAPATYVFDDPPLYELDQMETVDHVVGDAVGDYSLRVARTIAVHRARR